MPFGRYRKVARLQVAFEQPVGEPRHHTGAIARPICGFRATVVETVETLHHQFGHAMRPHPMPASDKPDAARVANVIRVVEG